MSRNPEINSFYFPNNWFNSCYDSLFASITLTLHKRQVHCSGVMQWWVCSSLMRPLLPAKAGMKVENGLFYCWCLLRNNNMATNLQRLTSCYGSRSFDCMWLLNANFLSGNATKTVAADSGKTHTFILCENKHEWCCSNVSTVWKIHCQCDVTSGVNRGSSQGVKLVWRQPISDCRGPTSQHSEKM